MSHGKFLGDTLSDDESAIDVSELPSEYRVKVCSTPHPPFPSSLSPPTSLCLCLFLDTISGCMCWCIRWCMLVTYF